MGQTFNETIQYWVRYELVHVLNRVVISFLILTAWRTSSTAAAAAVLPWRAAWQWQRQLGGSSLAAARPRRWQRQRGGSGGSSAAAGSLAGAAAAWRQRGRSSGSVAAAAAAWRQRGRGGGSGSTAVAAAARQRRPAWRRRQQVGRSVGSASPVLVTTGATEACDTPKLS
jgi:hypothetical protein